MPSFTLRCGFISVYLEDRSCLRQAINQRTEDPPKLQRHSLTAAVPLLFARTASTPSKVPRATPVSVVLGYGHLVAVFVNYCLIYTHTAVLTLRVHYFPPKYKYQGHNLPMTLHCAVTSCSRSWRSSRQTTGYHTGLTGGLGRHSGRDRSAPKKRCILYLHHFVDRRFDTYFSKERSDPGA